jgi:arginyl-tRNA synthetase
MSTTLERFLESLVQQLLSEQGIAIADTRVVPASRPEFGDYQWNGAIASGNREAAATIAAALLDRPEIAAASVAGPGFVNITVTESVLWSFAQQLPENLFEQPEKKRIIVDYGGPNVAKPLHVGHLRSAVVGNSIVRMLRAAGHDVTGDVHQGDWGTQMGMVLMGIKRAQPDLVFFDAGYAGEYPADCPVTLADLARIYPEQSALCKTDPEAKAAALAATLELQQGRRGYRALWELFSTISITDTEAIYSWLGVTFERWYGESHYNPLIPGIIEDLAKREISHRDDGAIIIPVGDDVPPLIFLKSDGAYLYATTDIATIVERMSEQFDAIHYVIDKRQELHIEQVLRATRKAGYLPETQEVAFHGFGTLNGPDGRPFKTRSGEVIALRDLIDQVVGAVKKTMETAGVAAQYPADEQEAIAHAVAIAAIKYGDLQNDKKSDYRFDPEKFTSFEGKTGPYVIYTAVRLQSLLRKFAEITPAFSDLPAAHTSECELLLVLLRTPAVFREALRQLAPHMLAEQLYLVSQAANRFYEHCRVGATDDTKQQAQWLAVSQLAALVIVQLADLLGIEVPERM